MRAALFNFKIFYDAKPDASSAFWQLPPTPLDRFFLRDTVGALELCGQQRHTYPSVPGVARGHGVALSADHPNKHRGGGFRSAWRPGDS